MVAITGASFQNVPAIRPSLDGSCFEKILASGQTNWLEKVSCRRSRNSLVSVPERVYELEFAKAGIALVDSSTKIIDTCHLHRRIRFLGSQPCSVSLRVL